MQQVFPLLLATMKRSTNPEQRAALADALSAVSGKLAAAEAQQVFPLLLATIKQTTKRWEPLAKTLTVTAAKLTPEDAQWAFGQLVTAIKQTIDPGQLAALAKP